MPKFDFTSNVRPSIFAYVPEQKAPEKDKVELVKTAVLSTTAKASARQREKEKEKGAIDGAESMDVDGTKPSEDETDTKADDNGDMKVDEAGASTTKKAPIEANFEVLPNLSRVVGAQMPYILFPSASRYLPIRPLPSTSSSVLNSIQPTKSSASPTTILQSIVDGPSNAGLGAGGGILVLKDTKPDEPVELMEEQAMRALQLAATGGEDIVPDQADLDAGPQPAQPALDVDLSSPIAPVPEPFEYDDFED